MLKLLMIRERIKKFYSLNNKYVDPAIKFIITLVSMLIINANIGAMNVLKNPVVVLGICVVGALLPKTLTVMMLIAVTLVHILAISPASAAVIALVFIVMYLLFFRFTAKYSYVLLAVPFLFFVKMPFVIPILMGLCATPITIIPVLFGTLIYFFINYFATNFDQLVIASADDAVTMMTNMAFYVFKNPAFYFTAGVFAAVICLVYFVRRLSVDHAWVISACAGGLFCTVAMLLGCIIFDMSSMMSIAEVIIGGLLSTAVAWLIQLFVHSVDYTRTEYTQFEDDEYYYYVKAVPKVQVLPAEKSIKRINARKANSKNRKSGRK